MKRVPIRRLHKPSGNDRCRYNKKEYWFGPHGSEESDRRYTAWLAELCLGNDDPPSQPNTVSVEMLAGLFLEYAERKYSDGEFHNCVSAVRCATKLYLKTSANNFGPLALEKVRGLMISKGWPRDRINSQTGRVRRMFRWGVSRELVRVHVSLALRELMPLRKGETIAPESNPVRPALELQVDALLPQLVPTLAGMLMTHRFTGMRPAELFGLKPCLLDRSNDVWVYRPEEHKNDFRGKALAYAIGPRAQQALAPLLEHCKPKEHVFKPANTILERRAIRGAARKTKRTPKQIAKMKQAGPPKVAPKYNRTSYRNALWKAALRAAGNDKGAALKIYFKPNQLRHKKGTDVRSEHGIEAARIALGHSHITTTLVYAEADLEKAKMIARASG